MEGPGTVFHWDGASWSEVDTPDIGWFIGFTGIVALSPTDAWLVGYKKAGHHTIVEHWDGTAWRIVASRNRDKLESLYAVAASGPSDLWSVGLSGMEAPPPGQAAAGRCHRWLARVNCSCTPLERRGNRSRAHRCIGRPCYSVSRRRVRREHGLSASLGWLTSRAAPS